MLTHQLNGNRQTLLSEAGWQRNGGCAGGVGQWRKADVLGQAVEQGIKVDRGAQVADFGRGVTQYRSENGIVTGHGASVVLIRPVQAPECRR